MKKIVITFFVVSIFLIFVGFGNMRGVCYIKLRPLNDDELIRAAVGYLLQNIKPGGRRFAMQGEKIVEVPPLAPVFVYQGVDDFIKRNPYCCSVASINTELGHVPAVSTRILGDFSGYVRIEYIDPNDPDIARREKKKTSYLAVTNCGDVWSGI